MNQDKIMKFEIKIPMIGESINEVTIGQWLVDDGIQVEEDQAVCEVESEKATVEITAEQSGVIKIIVPAGDTVNVGAVIAEIDVFQDASKQAKSKSLDLNHSDIHSDTNSNSEKNLSLSENKVSPVAANILRNSGIPLDSVTGSGQDGKVLKSDALNAVAGQSKDKISTETSSVQMDETLSKSGNILFESSQRTERREKMSTLRKTISRRLLEAKQGTAMLTTINEVDMSAIVELRKKFKEKFKEKYNVNLGFMSFFSKATALALEEFPIVNARLDNDEIVYHNYCDISIAVSTPKGLVVPVVRDVEKLSFAGIESKIAELAIKARDGKLTIEEMSGGTFSITNGGIFGSLISTPLINSPQSAILGMHTIQDRPVARDGQVVIRPMMYISLSYDHRIIDGRESVSFLVRMKDILEDPIRMVLFNSIK